MESWSDQSFNSHSDQVEFSAKIFKQALKRIEREYDWMQLGYYDDKSAIDYQMERVDKLDKENDELIEDYNKLCNLKDTKIYLDSFSDLFLCQAKFFNADSFIFI